MTGESASTIERTLRLVELLLAHPEGLSPREITDRLPVSRSTLFLLLRELKDLGYVEQSETHGRYRAGPRLLSWRASAPAQDLRQAFARELAHRSWPETLILVAPAGLRAENGLRVLAQAEGTERVRSAYEVGAEYTAELAAAACLLSARDAGCRSGDHAFSQQDHTLELALPVCPNGTDPEAALVLSAPAFRWQPDEFCQRWLPELRAAAARLSYWLGAPYYRPFQTVDQTELKASAPLPRAEIDALLNEPLAARLACLRPDGSPHVVPIWHDWDGAVFRIVAWQGSQWADYLTQNPQVSLTVDEPWPPLRRVVARGEARLAPLEPGSPQLDELLARMSRRYLGRGLSEQLSAQVEKAFIIQPDTLRGWQGFYLRQPAESSD